MKRVIAFVCVIVLAMAVLAACGQQPQVFNNNQQTPVTGDTDNGNVASTPASSAAASSAASSQAEVSIPEGNVTGTGTAPDGFKVEGVSLFSEYSNELFLFVTNNSGTDCNIKDIEINLFDADGKIIDVKNSYSIDAVQDGTTVVENFYCDDPFASYEYTLTTEELDYYVPVDKDLAVEVSSATNKAIISVTNNGKVAAKYPEYQAFFYLNGKLVDTDWGYVDDADSEIKPGATERETASCYEDFDDVKVFIHSYADKDD